MSNVAKKDLTWNFHVKHGLNQFDMGDMEIFDMELHVKTFMPELDRFDMEVPCQMLLEKKVHNLTWKCFLME